VSVEAISWALNLAPVPADRGGQPSSACKFVLVGLANHAGPDGVGAFPSVATLIRYTGLSERTVRTCLDRLEAYEIIRPCDPDIVAARIKRADRRPKGWDLDLSLVRDDLDQPGAAAPEGQSTIRRAGLAALWRPDHHGHPNEVQSPHPAARGVDNAVHEVQQSHPHRQRGATSAPTGCSRRNYGVQQLHPNRPENHPWNRPPPPRVRARRPLTPAQLAAAGRLASSSPLSLRTGG
jgi:Helix-turn-helix domain